MTRFVAGLLLFLLSPVLLVCIIVGMLLGVTIASAVVARHVIWQSYEQRKGRVLRG